MVGPWPRLPPLGRGHGPFLRSRVDIPHRCWLNDVYKPTSGYRRTTVMHITTVRETLETVVEHRWSPGDRITGDAGLVYVIGEIDIVGGAPCYRVQPERYGGHMPQRASVGDTVRYWDAERWRPVAPKTWLVTASLPPWCVVVEAGTEEDAVDKAHNTSLRHVPKDALSARQIEYVS